MAAISLMNAYELLQCYGYRAFYSFIHDQAKNGLTRAILHGDRDFLALRDSVKSILAEDLTVLGEQGIMDTSLISPDRPYIYGHPKLQILEKLVLDHFQQEMDERVGVGGASTSTGVRRSAADGPVDSRIMIFTSYRNSVQVGE